MAFSYLRASASPIVQQINTSVEQKVINGLSEVENLHKFSFCRS